MKIIIWFFLLIVSVGCSKYEMDNFQSWCAYQIKDIDADVISVDREKIRVDLVKIINDALMKGVDGRIDKMAWLEDKHLHIENLSSLFDVDPSKMINQYRSGITDYKNCDGIKDVEGCFYGAIYNFFDDIIIHSGEPDSYGLNWQYTETIIKTGRREEYLKSKVPAIRKMAESPDF